MRLAAAPNRFRLVDDEPAPGDYAQVIVHNSTGECAQLATDEVAPPRTPRRFVIHALALGCHATFHIILSAFAP